MSVTPDELRSAEQKFRADFAAAEQSRARRNELVMAARRAGWSYQRIADATGLTRGRLSQIVKSAGL